MYEANGRINWSNLFIKVIIVIIFVLFTVWLLSLSNRGISNQLNVLTDNIFAENIDRMKEVGKEYFTVERLPEELGDIKTITLERMYEKKLILNLKDKNGNACSAENSYVSIEKMENEYQMKVYLECGDESDYIKVIMGCYDYCDTDICEVKEQEEIKNIEYEYSKTTGGKWSDWGNWSEWSKTVVTKADYRDVDTKVVEENYSYVKDVVKTEYTQDAVCKDIAGYELISNNNGKCTYQKVTSSTKTPTCPTVSGYTLVKRDGFTCSYNRTNTSNANPTCPSKEGYTVSRNGFTCNYTKSSTLEENPTCPSKEGYTVSRNGFTCNYSKSETASVSLSCPSLSGWTYTGRNGTTCNYSQSYRVAVGKKLVSTCDGCGAQWQTIYETRYNYTTQTANSSCPSGYSVSGGSCVKTSTATETATCPSGYTKNGNVCTKSVTETTTGTATCPSGYAVNGTTCTKIEVLKASRTATCPSGYAKEGSDCVKYTVDEKEADATCPTGQKIKDGKCYKDVTHKETINEVRKVTYYRYRLRSYTGGTTDYKWSSSKEDKNLLNAGYKLTGKTREVK